MQRLQNQSVLILGLGESGLAMARWCVRCGANVQVVDTREAPPQLAQLQAELPQVQFVCGAFEASLVQGQSVQAVFKSPGLSPAVVAPVWQAAIDVGLWVGTELTLFAQALQDLQSSKAYHPKVLAIMGGIFVVEALSVMVQVSYFKYTKKKYGEGRRILKMAPLHHHFEKSGWKETQVVVRFWIITMLLCLLGLSTLKLR